MTSGAVSLKSPRVFASGSCDSTRQTPASNVALTSPAAVAGCACNTPVIGFVGAVSLSAPTVEAEVGCGVFTYGIVLKMSVPQVAVDIVGAVLNKAGFEIDISSSDITFQIFNGELVILEKSSAANSIVAIPDSMDAFVNAMEAGVFVSQASKFVIRIARGELDFLAGPTLWLPFTLTVDEIVLTGTIAVWRSGVTSQMRTINVTGVTSDSASLVGIEAGEVNLVGIQTGPTIQLTGVEGEQK